MFYKFSQIRRENIGLNKFLIAFGLLYGFGFTGVVLRSINSFYIENPVITVILNNVSHIVIAIALFSFLIVISQKDFNELINTKITKIVALIALIFSFIILFVEEVLIFLILIFASIFIGFIFMTLFHIKLIQKSTGNVKNRIILLFFGEIIIIIAVIFGIERNPYLYPPNIQDLARYFFSIIMILGQLVVFYAFYDFPIFLEFNWQKNLIKLYIVDKNRRKVLYNYNFLTNQNEIIKELDNNGILFSSGLIGIEEIIAIISKTNQEKIQRINLEDRILLFNYGSDGLDSLLFCILVNNERVSINYFLKMIKIHFQKFYKNVLYDLEAVEGSELKIFKKFNKQLNTLLRKL
ncbi:MAG: hypothetical protein ACFE9S_01260 [Candidatus Hermodarchaeota archaeon]